MSTTLCEFTDRIRSLLTAGVLPDIADWKLEIEHERKLERYYVAEAVEQARFVVSLAARITLYIDRMETDGTRVRGIATATLYPAHSDDELLAILQRATAAARISKNPWFDLVEPAAGQASSASSLEQLERTAAEAATINTSSMLDTAASALFAPARSPASVEQGSPSNYEENSPCVRINSLEVFASSVHHALLNSRGLCCTSCIPKCSTEFVTEARQGSNIVELFDALSCSTIDKDRLSQATATRLSQVLDRLQARPLPHIHQLPVIFSGREAEDLFGWFFGITRTNLVYSKASPYVQGTRIQGNRQGNNLESRMKAGSVLSPDSLTLFAEPILAGLPQSRSYDSDGFPLAKTLVIEKGVVKALTGPVRHADWLGVPRHGEFQLFSVEPGSATAKALCSIPHLRPVVFSDFSVSPLTGDFGAEIRLAYLYDGTGTFALTGGSLSGSLPQLQHTMRWSMERTIKSRSLSPDLLMLEGVSITPAGE
ncbi:MAG: metallopeptidase TldD-related protein [Spirochaetales bacterium]|nr:metallopeptidase TldD-related protein [Spirochaetales bacterium]